jgi:hypothetical protein
MTGDRTEAGGGPAKIGGPVALPSETAAFIQSGVSILIAACGSHGAPLPGFAHACVVDPARAGEVRLLVGRRRNGALLAACAAGSALAATFANLAHRSLQLKTSRAQVRPPEPDDFVALAWQSARYRAWLTRLGYGDEYCAFFAGHDAEDVVAIAFAPEQAFVQTPGPGAGEPLRP